VPASEPTTPASEDELALALQLARHLVKLRPQSEWAFNVAMTAMETDGIEGALVIRIPKRTDHPLDLTFTVGPVKMEITS